MQLPTEMLGDEGSHGEGARVKEDPGALGSTPGECEKAGTERGWSEMGHRGWGRAEPCGESSLPWRGHWT